MSEATANFELGVNGNDILVADAGSATAWDSRQNNDGGGNTLKYDNVHVYGSLAAKFDNSGAPSSACVMGWSTGIGTLTDHYGRVYLYATANPVGGSWRIGRDGNNNFPIFINANGTVTMNDQGGVAVTTTAAIGLNQWVRIEYHWINSLTVGQVELKLFNSPDSSTPTETQTSAANRNTSASTTSLEFGLGGGQTTAGAIWLDNIVAGATSYPGPFVSGTQNLAPGIYGRGAA